MAIDPLIAGVELSKWPDDEIAFLPWTLMVGLTEEEQVAVSNRIRAVLADHPEWAEAIRRRVYVR